MKALLFLTLIAITACSRKTSPEMLMVRIEDNDTYFFEEKSASSTPELRSMVRDIVRMHGPRPVTVKVQGHLAVSNFTTIAEIFAEEGIFDIYTSSLKPESPHHVFRVIPSQIINPNLQWDEQHFGSENKNNEPNSYEYNVYIYQNTIIWNNAEASLDVLIDDLSILLQNETKLVMITADPKTSHERLVSVLKTLQRSNIDFVYLINPIITLSE